MLLEEYLKNNNLNLRQMHIFTGIPEATVRNINKRKMEKWSLENFEAISNIVGKDKHTVIREIEELNRELQNSYRENALEGKYELENRRYIGSKARLLPWISGLIEQHTSGNSFFDVFAGTGVVTKEMLKKFDTFYINDFLYSNNTIYNAFFGKEVVNITKMCEIKNAFQKIDPSMIKSNYFSENYGGKFFSQSDAKIIGEIRARIEKNTQLNIREKSILVASLMYSADKIANTVGHYEAYRKNVKIHDKFLFELINPLNTSQKNINIYQEDSNELARKIKTDVAFIDPPYNSRQYSRFYHVLEGLAKWDKPKLEGVAMKPKPENMSDYSTVSAPKVFDDLISNINAKYIVVTYNNTYTSKSSSSKNKITHDEIISSLNKVGKTKIFEQTFQFFNAGKTNLDDHKEFVFITKVGAK